MHVSRHCDTTWCRSTPTWHASICTCHAKIRWCRRYAPVKTPPFQNHVVSDRIHWDTPQLVLDTPSPSRQVPKYIKSVAKDLITVRGAGVMILQRTPQQELLTWDHKQILAHRKILCRLAVVWRENKIIVLPVRQSPPIASASTWPKKLSCAQRNVKKIHASRRLDYPSRSPCSHSAYWEAMRVEHHVLNVQKEFNPHPTVM